MASDGARLMLTKAGAPLGVRATSSYSEGTFRVDPSAAVVLYTDGLIERRDEGIDASLARLVDIVGRIGTPIDAETIATGLGENELDDVVVLVVQRAPLGERPQASTTQRDRGRLRQKTNDPALSPAFFLPMPRHPLSTGM